ncbi:SRPBCC family protein [Phycicoccus sp. Root101]|uniref:SRPBCC family protein n=1 Tax=Phycicoccus sp. Root101 TaxID=1736421 RepID=UPI00350F66F0
MQTLCPMEALPLGDDALVSVDVSVECTIERPSAEVAAFAGDPGRAPEWYANIVSVRWLTPVPLSVGSRMDFVAHFLGRRLAYTYEVVELVPGRRLVMRTADGPFPMETTYEWEPVHEGATRMTLRNQGSPSGFAKISEPMVKRAMTRATTKDLARLKGILEASG